MTHEELLMPRYKVIADYPNSVYPVGSILKKIDGVQLWVGEKRISLSTYDLEKHPHLFKEMSWWEDRDEKDMPEYVKPIKAPEYVFKVDSYIGILTYFIGTNGKRVVEQTKVFLPATEEEYLNQNK